MSTYSLATIARDIADSVARETEANKAGVVVGTTWNNFELFFVIWSMSKAGPLRTHKLPADQTSPERLAAHVRGFIENHLADWA